MSIRRGLRWAVALAAVLSMFGPVSAAPQGLSRAIDGVARGGDVSVAVAVRGKTLYEHASDERRTPASVQKVLLSVALFDEFGPSHRIPTRVMSATTSGAIGNLWIVGGGDPSMVSGWGDATHTGVQRLANRIERAGITRVSGSVVVDSSLFADDWHAPGWQASVTSRTARRPLRSMETERRTHRSPSGPRLPTLSRGGASRWTGYRDRATPQRVRESSRASDLRRSELL